jgi:hypothetical protein
MLPVIEVFMATHGLPDVTVWPQPQPDSSRSRSIEANPAASSFNGGQGVLPVLAVEGALGSHATGGLSTRSRVRRTGSPRSQCWVATGRSTGLSGLAGAVALQDSPFLIVEVRGITSAQPPQPLGTRRPHCFSCSSQIRDHGAALRVYTPPRPRRPGHDRPLSGRPARMLALDCTIVARPTETSVRSRLERASPFTVGYIKASAALKGCSAAVQLTGRGAHELHSICRRRDPFPLPGPRGRRPRPGRARAAWSEDGSQRRGGYGARREGGWLVAGAQGGGGSRAARQQPPERVRGTIVGVGPAG